MKFNFGIDISTINMDWHELFLYLSMDIFRPDWKDIGLDIENQDELIEFIREKHYPIVNYLEMWFFSEVAASEVERRIQHETERINKVFNEIEERFGTDLAEKLYRWGLIIAVFGEKIDGVLEYDWGTNFEILLDKTQIPNDIPLVLPPEKLDKIKKYALDHLFRHEEIYNEMDKYEHNQSILSLWDRKMIAYYHCHVKWDGFSNIISNFVSRVRFYSHWKLWYLIDPLLTEEEKVILTDWGNERGKEFDRKVEYPMKVIERIKSDLESDSKTSQ